MFGFFFCYLNRKAFLCFSKWFFFCRELQCINVFVLKKAIGKGLAFKNQEHWDDSSVNMKCFWENVFCLVLQTLLPQYDEVVGSKGHNTYSL